jgi:RND family efflux transporter MFP subunit
MMEEISRWRLPIGLAAVVLIGVGACGPTRPPQAPTPAVATTIVHRGDFAHHVDSDATMEAWQTADLYPKVSGYLSDVRVDIGDHVKAGQVLAVISLPETEKELAEDEAQLAAKRAEANLQQITLKRQEQIYSGHGITDQMMDEARAKTSVATAQADLAAATVQRIQTMLAYTKIVAPYDGTVARRLVNQGNFVQAATAGVTTPLFTVENLSTIRVFAEVPEADAALLRIGDPVTIHPYGSTGKDKDIPGKITRFADRLDPATRNMRTEIDLQDTGHLYPGMYALVSLKLNQRHNVLTVPSSAIVAAPSGSFVYGAENGHVAQRRITTGATEDGAVEVLTGLADGSEVITDAKTAPPIGSPVKTTPSHAP